MLKVQPRNYGLHHSIKCLDFELLTHVLATSMLHTTIQIVQDHKIMTSDHFSKKVKG